MSPPKAAGVKPHGPPDALPAILFFVLPLIFAIGVTPLLASNYNPQVNAGRLEIRVASFDNGPIGSAFMSFVASTKGAVAGLPGLNVVDASTTSPEALRQAVRDSEVWGAIWVEADSSARLTSALTTPNNPYISTALHFAWDEGRNPLVTTARVGAPIKGYLAGFTASFASSFARSVSNATVLDVVRTNSQLLTAPVTVKEESLFPAADKPVTGVGLSIGNILIAVFALAITNAVLMGLAPVFARWGFRGTKMIAARTAVILAYTAIISATMATMLITLAGMNSHGDAWARTWATFWVMQASFVFYLSACAMWKGPAVLPLFFLFLLLANIIGGWNTDLADGGYMAFSCTSMYHALSLLRYVIFGSGHTKVGLNVGVLILWLAVDFALFVGVSVWKGRQMAAAAKAAAGAEAPAALTKEEPAVVEAPAAKSEGEPAPVTGAAAV